MLNDREVEYTLKQTRRARQMRIAVYCDASVVVTAPFYFGVNKIDKFLQIKANWVLSKIDKFLRIGARALPVHSGRRDYKKYREQARALVHAKIKEINQIYNFSFNKIAIKNHKTRWGSCSKKRNMNFNYKIIFLPERLAVYIVAHELCHLGEFNHSQKFWNLVSRAVPDYKEARVQIRKQVL